MSEVKNVTIEQRLTGYINGVILPEIDLSAAKTEVRRRRGRQSRKIAAALISIVASAVLLAAVIPQFITAPSTPQDTPPATADTTYSIEDAAPMSVIYTSLREKYPDTVAPFAPFFMATNAEAQYSIYELSGRETLLLVDLSYLRRGVQARASVYVDLTGGELEAEEFASYKELGTAYGYRYEMVYESGEYVSRAYFTLADGSDCYLDLMSNSREELNQLINLLRT